MADLRTLTRIVNAQASITSTITAALVEQLLELWRPFDGWYDGEMVRAISRESASLVEAAQTQVRRQTIATLQQQYEDLDAVFPEDEIDEVLLPFRYSRERGGESIEQIWERPVKTHRRFEKSLRYAEGQQWAADRIDREVESRIKALAEMDMALAQRDQEHEVLAAEPNEDEVAQARKKHKARGRKTQKVVGFRRIIHPEESKTGTCGLCVAAASRKYSREDLKEIHNGCKCTVSVITAAEDPGFDLNEADLNKLYKAAGSTGRGDLQRVRVTVEENGELGPVLKADGETEIVEDMAAKRAAAVEAARDAKTIEAKAAMNADRIAEVEKRLAAARKSVAHGEKLLDEKVDPQKAQYIRHAALKRITRYEQELEALTKPRKGRRAA